MIIFSARRAAKEAKEAPAQPAPVSTVVCIFLKLNNEAVLL